MKDKTYGKGDRPDLVGNYRPVAIRSVIAAHAMILKPRSGFAVPAGFRPGISPAEAARRVRALTPPHP